MSNIYAIGASNTLRDTQKEDFLNSINGVSSSADTAKTLATGSAVFTNSTNNIALTGIGIGVEIGDVIQISGAANAKNNSEFTVEVVTDDNNIIVNQAHAGESTSKALVSETATVTVKLLCKWYLAPIGLGQGWVGVTSSRVIGTLYSNQTGRTILAKVTMSGVSGRLSGTVNGVTINASGHNDAGAALYSSISMEIGGSSSYKAGSDTIGSNLSGVLFNWSELR